MAVPNCAPLLVKIKSASENVRKGKFSRPTVTPAQQRGPIAVGLGRRRPNPWAHQKGSPWQGRPPGALTKGIRLALFVMHALQLLSAAGMENIGGKLEKSDVMAATFFFLNQTPPDRPPLTIFPGQPPNPLLPPHPMDYRAALSPSRYHQSRHLHEKYSMLPLGCIPIHEN